MNAQREGRVQEEKDREFYRAGAGSACQALRNSWSICPCLQPVGNKKELKRRRGWTGLGASNRLQMPLLERAPCEKSRSPSLSPEPPFREKSPSLL